MNGSILIHNGNKNSRLATLSKLLEEVGLTLSSPNVMKIDVLEGKKSISIDQVREGTNFVQKSPHGHPQKALIIMDAHKMTAEAQNSLLKTLEEPPSFSSIILVSKTQDSLLPTVISRCRRIKADNEEGGGVGETSEWDINDILLKDLGERLMKAEELSKLDKTELIEILEIWIFSERKLLGENPEKRFNIELILEILDGLENTNVNTRLSMEYLLLSLQ